MAFFHAKIKIKGYDQNMGASEKVFLFDWCIYGALFQKWKDRANERPF